MDNRCISSLIDFVLCLMSPVSIWSTNEWQNVHALMFPFKFKFCLALTTKPALTTGPYPNYRAKLIDLVFQSPNIYRKIFVHKRGNAIW